MNGNTGDSDPGYRPRIAVFSGPRATIQSCAPLTTGRGLRPQRLAAPVTVYVEAYSAHPLEADAVDLYAEPEGYLDHSTGAFSTTRPDGDCTPVFRASLTPEDGLYPLPYLARQANGRPWVGHQPTGTEGRSRQQFYPDASRIFEEIDRFGVDYDGQPDLLAALADFDFYRAAPSGGFVHGQSAALRTDCGTGDIAPEKPGVDFFPYMPRRYEPTRSTLARLTNTVADTLASGAYEGAIWLEGTPTIEETIYWLNLIVDTDRPIVGTASQQPHGVLGNDGDHNLVQAAAYIASGVWADAAGCDLIGAVVVANSQVFTSREVHKADARPGGYVAAGGHGGVIGNTVWQDVELTFLPTRRHTHTSTVKITELPHQVRGTHQTSTGPQQWPITVKDRKGHLIEGAIPKVTVVKYVNYGSDDSHDIPDGETEILARIDKNLRDFPLAGFVAEGSTPYGITNEPMRAALTRAVLAGMPVVCVGRGNTGGFVPKNPAATNAGLFIAGSNLTATKARMLLMAAMLKQGSIPAPADPRHPTPDELAAARAAVAAYQSIFDSH